MDILQEVEVDRELEVEVNGAVEEEFQSVVVALAILPPGAVVEIRPQEKVAYLTLDDVPEEEDTMEMAAVVQWLLLSVTV